MAYLIVLKKIRTFYELFTEKLRKLLIISHEFFKFSIFEISFEVERIQFQLKRKDN